MTKISIFHEKIQHFRLKLILTDLITSVPHRTFGMEKGFTLPTESLLSAYG